MENQSICGLVQHQEDAEQIIRALVEAGVNPNEISILSSQEKMTAAPDRSRQESSRNWRTENRIPEYALENQMLKSARDAMPKLEKHSHAAQGATAGVTTGSVLGGTLGLLAGIGALAIPGIGPLVAAGPLMAALSGMGAGGTIGSIIGALIGLGIPEREVLKYEHQLKEGSILLSASTHSETETKCILTILKKHGAQNISILESERVSNINEGAW